MQSKSIQRFIRKHSPCYNVLVCDSAHQETYRNIKKKIKQSGLESGHQQTIRSMARY